MPEKFLSIREATQADIAAIGDLARTIWPVVYSSILSAEQVQYMLGAFYSHEALLQQMTDLRQQFFILDVQHQPRGFASYTLGPGPVSAKLNKLYLAPELHGQGIGKILLHTVEQRLKTAGCLALYLNVNRHNPARYFYEGQGFRVIGTEDIPVGPYWMNDFIMRKPLA